MTARHESDVSYRNLYGALIERRSKSGSGPAAVEHLFEVWLCSFACVAECVFPASQKAHGHLPTV